MLQRSENFQEVSGELLSNSIASNSAQVDLRVYKSRILPPSRQLCKRLLFSHIYLNKIPMGLG